MRPLALIGIAFVIAACSSSTVPPSASPVREPTAPATSSPQRPVAFGDGRHLVGDEIEAGTYRAIVSVEADSDPCYWERLSGLEGSEDQTIANSAGVGPRVTTIEPTDVAFASTGCGAWSSDLSPLPGQIEDGVWIVGTEIQPGIYEAPGGPLCYWQRLAGFGGTAEEDLEVGSPDDPPVVEVTSTDTGFSSSRCGEWVLRPD